MYASEFVQQAMQAYYPSANSVFVLFSDSRKLSLVARTCTRPKGHWRPFAAPVSIKKVFIPTCSHVEIAKLSHAI